MHTRKSITKRDRGLLSLTSQAKRRGWRSSTALGPRAQQTCIVIGRRATAKMPVTVKVAVLEGRRLTDLRGRSQESPKG